MSTTPTLAQVRTLLEETYPLHWAEDWDRVGLIVGEADAPVRRIALAVDPTLAVARAAADDDLLITHHPLLLRGVHALPTDTGKGAVVTSLIRSGTALWCGHTNADRALTGTGVALADALGLTGREPLEPPRQTEDGLFGAGVIGVLEAPLSVRELARRLAAAVPATVQGVRFTGDPDRQVQRVVACPGAGDSFLEAATRAGADVIVTSDLRHHPALEHIEAAADPAAVPALLDLPHYASESLWLVPLRELLLAQAALRDWDLQVRIDEHRTDVWTGAEGTHPA
ncbi:Nif3-like dinuclear metal center hexameric protein [Brachybacterium sp. EF45031]|uniref:Nif3-like dinuclear metal center hexameric protein n=1 Tax=Brachybacterium sillae TaxID=2810536 RepID=UPI00217E9B85|nr:Nif3-like dinuclear metal center hexameric protein [Brachybacterium sillae]MCS6710729.1 Nif3-like dinuclear metal center hexameric protein [Brachybacterium sillae]